jgi:hypothetical protein
MSYADSQQSNGSCFLKSRISLCSFRTDAKDHPKLRGSLGISRVPSQGGNSLERIPSAALGTRRMTNYMDTNGIHGHGLGSGV